MQWRQHPQQVGLGINRRLTADAVSEIGLDPVTMESVAQRIGLSTAAALYHHVSGRKDCCAWHASR
ncbi:hypothetical protein A5624_26765 [Mycobacterium sp. 1482292.6]|nr:hypothetical protein A5624_26765 [Mycobacterium sp. 1482292.6]OBJ21603.1 hypothetical protein A5622_17155 [Mycobacterium sp. 1245801.1]